MQKCLNHKGGGTMKKYKDFIIYIFKKIFPKVFSVAPMLFIFNHMLFLLNGILYMLTTLSMQLLFDKVIYLSLNKQGLKEAILALNMLLAIKIGVELISGLANFLAQVYSPKITKKLYHIINLKISKLDPSCFENPDTLDVINKAYLGTCCALKYIHTIMNCFLFYFPYFLFMGIYLFKLNKILVISLILLFVPSVYTASVRRRFFSGLEDRLIPLRRKVDYYSECIVGRKYTKETRILGVHSYFMNLLKESIDNMNKLKRSTTIKLNLVELSTKLISLLAYLGVFFLTFYALMNEEITVGAFAAIFASIDNMFSLMDEYVYYKFQYYSENIGKIENFLRFFQLPERDYKKKDIKVKRENIKLKNVCFSYPGSNKNTLYDINLEINKGETLAIVGENGAGKSTLVKLIIGMYLPTKGAVLFQGEDSKDFTMENIFNNVSAVFQDFQKYRLTLKDNIEISDCNNREDNKNRLEFALEGSGINVNHKDFNLGYNTVLSREFSGVDLSEGQWQRIAVARGLYRTSDFIVLDEPTAAIDPISEEKIYKQFNEACSDKTAIIVTHRLGSIKFADRIVVMKDGKILDVGTHTELLERCDFYKIMWRLQVKLYDKSGEYECNTNVF